MCDLLRAAACVACPVLTFIHVVACVILLTGEQYPIVWLDHAWCVHSSVDGHVGCFPFR